MVRDGELVFRENSWKAATAASGWKAMVITGNEFEVIGSGAVTVVDAGGITHTNLHDVKEGEGLELHEIRVHLLPAGAHYSLPERKPLALAAGARRG
jgi:cyanophycinase